MAKKNHAEIAPKIIKKFELRLHFNLKTLLTWGLVVFLVLSFLASASSAPSASKIPLSQALQDIKDQKIDRIEVEDGRLNLTYKDGQSLVTQKETGVAFTDILKSAEISPETVNFTIKDIGLSKLWLDLISNILPIILMVAFFFIIYRQARGAQDSIFSFGRSSARMFVRDGKQPKITFKDVAGVDEAKKELSEVVDFLKNSDKYKKLGARTPKGVLLVGPSGTGKTLLAKAVAGEANVPFFSMAGSEFMEMLVGVGASRVRDLFNTAKKAAPAIIFIDEIDAIGRQRATGVFSGGHDEREQTLNQILVEMDGFTTNDNVMVIAATNRGDLLDSALLRPGRFDRRVVLDLPDVEGREAILKIHGQGKIFASDINWPSIAKQTVGFSGADLENMLNEAAIFAAGANKVAIEEKDIREASVKVKLGPERKRLQSLDDRKMTAYHEAGHALVSFYSPQTDPVRRVSIVARGASLGHTMISPTKDRTHETKTRLEEQISVMMGGRAAEQMIFKEMTTGAANDIANATRLSRAMVVNFGMSKIGPIYLGSQSEEGEMGRMLWYEPANLSPQMQAKIDEEIKKITDAAYRRAVTILKTHKTQMDTLAKALLEKETLEEEEFEGIMKSEKIKTSKKVLADIAQSEKEYQTGQAKTLKSLSLLS